MPESAREIDSNGFLIVRGCPISTYGVFDYSAGQIGLDGDPNRIVKVYRPEYAVKDPQAIESFKDVPLVDDHTMLSGFDNDPENVDPDEKGVSGILTSHIYYQKPWMRGDIKIFSRGVKDKILSKMKDDLSLGFGCKYRLESGVWNGQAYEVVQDHIRGNHLALVDEGRIPGARVLDGRCFDHLNFDIINNMGIETMKKPIPVNKINFLKKKAAELSKVAKDAGETALKEGEQGMDDGNPAAQILSLLPQLTQALTAFFGQEETEPAHEDPNAAPAATEPVEPETDGEPTDPTDIPASPEEPTSNETGEEPTATAPEQTDPNAAGGDLPSLIAQVKALLAQIEGGAATDAPENLPAGKDAEPYPVPMPAKGKDTEELPTDESTDAVAGLQEQSKPGAMMKTDDNKVSMDAALKYFREDESKKLKLYNRLSRVIGAFNHSTMDSKQVGAYGVKKLGLPCQKGFESVALDAYFSAIEKAATQQKAIQAQRVAAMDSAIYDAPTGTPELDSYINGGK